MTWNAPYTAVAGGTVSSADFNTYVRDNLAETMPAKALNVGSLFAVSGQNQIAERIPDFTVVDTSETTSSTSYTNLATVGPAITCTSGPFVVVTIGARIGPQTVSGASARMSWACSGATTRAASDTWAAGFVVNNTSAALYTSRWYYAGVTAGSNTFTAQYAVSSGTGTFQYRSIAVIPL